MGEVAVAILRARRVLPMARGPIENGAVAVAGGVIVGVGRWPEVSARFPGAEVTDLGDSALLPGLINAHCHLDYTDMAGQIAPTRSFTDWIKSITTLKAAWSYTEFAESWINGARMLLQSGVTTVGDIEASPELLPDVWEATGLRVYSFLEMTGIRSRRAPRDILQEAVTKIDSLPAGRCAAGLSPHAPYSTLPELLQLSARVAAERDWRVTCHVAESAQEFEMFASGGGELHEWLRRNERDMSDCGHGSPVEHLEQNGLLSERLLAIHVNYLDARDADLLARRGVNVVHCPRSHAYFKHRAFPLGELTRAGVNVCLGTDSLVTVQKEWKQPLILDLFAELRTLAAAMPAVTPEELLKMATLNGARALGYAGRLGEITEGAFADLIVAPLPTGARDTCEAVVHHPGPVPGVMIDGLWVVQPTGKLSSIGAEN